MDNDSNPDSIAVVSLVARFAGSGSAEAFWESLRAGREGVRRFTDEELRAAGISEEAAQQDGFVPYGGPLEDKYLFDAQFFGMSNRDAQMMDPQIRLFVEGAWQALEEAGYDSRRFDGRIGVFAGMFIGDYFFNHVLANPDLIRLFGTLRLSQLTLPSHAATTTSYKLGLNGPSLTLQSACSTSLTTIHYACQSLLNSECDMALAGAAYVRCPGEGGYVTEPGSIFSPDGHCRPFDDAAAGTLFTEGLGVVALRRLDDALDARDNILAVIRGSAINNDGEARAGYNAPGVSGQAHVVAEGLAMAGVSPDVISFVEAHGTGTAVGDPIELTALTEVFGGPREDGSKCAVGSVKGNVGHANTASGMAGFAKVVLSLMHKTIPPTINCRTPTTKFDFSRSPFYVETSAIPWPPRNGRRVAGLSSFGMGGTNVHMVIEEAPEPLAVDEPRRPVQLLVMSTRSNASRSDLESRWRDVLEREETVGLADLAFTARRGRRAFSHRTAIVASTRAEALEALTRDTIRGRAPEKDLREVVFMFPGQGSQHPGVGRQLYAAESAFRVAFDRCAAAFAECTGDELTNWAFSHADGADAKLMSTERTQPVVFAVSYALAELWRSWGVSPVALIGHSLGEYVAACVSGVLDVDTAVRLVAERGRLMASMPPGVMYAVQASAEELEPALGGAVELAGVNAPRRCVVTGPEPDVMAWLRSEARPEWDPRRVRVSHAFHSSMMDPVLAEFESYVRKHAVLRAPVIPYVSNVTGTWITAEQAQDAGYYAEQLRRPVRFADGIRTLVESPRRMLLEVGPGEVLTASSRRQVDTKTIPTAASLPPHRETSADARSELTSVLRALAALWVNGVEVEWGRFDGDEKRRRARIPTYPFERRRHWLPPGVLDVGAAAVDREDVTTDGDADHAASAEQEERGTPPSTPTQEVIARVWGELLGVKNLSREDNFFELGGDSVLITSMVQRIREEVFPGLQTGAIYEASTVEAFAAKIDEQRAGDSSGAKPEPAVDVLDATLQRSEALAPEQDVAEFDDDVIGQIELAEDEN